MTDDDDIEVEIDWSKVLRFPTASELLTEKVKRLATKGRVISTHRGHDIVRVDETNYEVWEGSFKITSCGSAWSCICYIDERLSP